MVAVFRVQSQQLFFSHEGKQINNRKISFFITGKWKKNYVFMEYRKNLH